MLKQDEDVRHGPLPDAKMAIEDAASPGVSSMLDDTMLTVSHIHVKVQWLMNALQAQQALPQRL